MSDTTPDRAWRVPKHAVPHLRVEPRGTEASTLRVEFDTQRRLLGVGSEAAEKMIGAELTEALASDPIVVRYVLLREKAKAIEADLRTAALAVEQTQLDHRKLTNAPYTPDQPQQLAQLDSSRRTAEASHASLTGLQKAVQAELATARDAAERAAHRAAAQSAPAKTETDEPAPPAEEPPPAKTPRRKPVAAE